MQSSSGSFRKRGVSIGDVLYIISHCTGPSSYGCERLPRASQCVRRSLRPPNSNCPKRWGDAVERRGALFLGRLPFSANRM